MRHYKGKLVKLPRRFDQTLEEQAKELVNEKVLEQWNKTYLDQLLDEGDYKEYMVINGDLYKTKNLTEKNADNGLFNARRINGNDYEFEVRFYDGGCSLSEAINTALGVTK